MQLTRAVPHFWEFTCEAVWLLCLYNRSALAGRLRQLRYRTQCKIDTGVLITNWRNLDATAGSTLYHGCHVLNDAGMFALGRNSHLGAGCHVNCAHGTVHIGEDVAIGPGCAIFSYSNYYRYGTKVTHERITMDVRIGNNVFIGSGTRILPGTTIKDNVVIGAGSVVKGILEPDGIYVGSPCRRVREGWHG